MIANELIPAISGLSGIDRDIAVEMHGRDFAQYGAEKAFRKAVETPSFGRMKALDREVDRAQELEEFLIMGLLMMDD